MIKPKPCPFCGRNVQINRSMGFVTIEHVEDGPCILNAMESFWCGGLQAFIDEWNRRVNE